MQRTLTGNGCLQQTTASRIHDHDRLGWFEGPFAYSLAGKLDRDGMLGLAKAVYNHIVA